LPNQQQLKQQSGDQRAIAQMQAFIHTRGDRWKFLLNTFGFEE